MILLAQTLTALALIAQHILASQQWMSEDRSDPVIK